jgi:hypothetical protein
VYRILCLSRNLTFDRAWDTCLCLEGRLTGRKRGYARNAPLAEFLRSLPGMATGPLEPSLGADISRIADEVRRVDFQPPPPFDDFRFHPLGLSARHVWPFPDTSRGLVVSPYLVSSVVDRLTEDHGLDVLVSRPEAFEEMLRGRPDDSPLPRECFVLSPGAMLDSREMDEEPAGPTGTDGAEASTEEPGPPPAEDRPELAGLHAKLFLLENGGRAHLFTGSANATRAAFGQNVEFLVELVGPTNKCGIKALLGADDDRQSHLRSLLEEYRPPDQFEVVDEVQAGLDRKVERLAHDLGAVQLQASVRETDGGERWDVALSGSLPDIPAGVEVTVWPVTLPAEAARAVRTEGPRASSGGSGHDIARFDGVSFEALTGFFAFEITLRDGTKTARRRFTATARLEGAPADRKERLLRSFLKDRRQVLRLLLLLLMDEGADVSMFVDGAQGRVDKQGPLGGPAEPTLLEALLRSLSQNPDRIEHVARLISDLGSTPEGRDLLPEGLDAIWEPVWKAREALR